MKQNFILYEESEKVGLITINRPDKLNALNRALLEELSETLEGVAKGQARAIVITGAGSKAFVAGADLEEIASFKAAELWNFLRTGQKTFRAIEQLGIPVIGAINGLAMGGGFELALACHMRVASPETLFSFPEVGLGLLPGFGGTQRLPKAVGKARALEYLCTGNRIKGEEAYSLGLVNHLVEADNVLGKAKEIAGQIASKAPVAVKMILEAVEGGSELDIERGEVLEAGVVSMCAATQDCLEGLASFREKRKPIFQGK